jgi:hypothetical protein
MSALAFSHPEEYTCIIYSPNPTNQIMAAFEAADLPPKVDAALRDSLPWSLQM